MSTPQHTQGPWWVNVTRVDHAIVRFHIASEKHGSAFPICDHVIEAEPDGTEQLANARLIAAAPDLLAALIACEDQLRGVTGALPGSDSAEVCDAARAAIARATAK